jgi:large subunit ribosomal protein L35
MPKMKTNKSVAKRVKVTARGKLMRHRAGTGHLKSRKSNKQLRRMRKGCLVAGGFARQAKAMLGLS